VEWCWTDGVQARAYIRLQETSSLAPCESREPKGNLHSDFSGALCYGERQDSVKAGKGQKSSHASKPHNQSGSGPG